MQCLHNLWIVINVDFLVDPYPSEMVQDLFSSGSYAVVWNPYASGQGTSMI